VTLPFALVTALKDLRRRAADPLALVLWLGLPVMVAVLLSLANGAASQGPRGVVLLADEDASLVGRLIEGSLAQGPLAALFQVTRTDATKGRATLAAGNASALIIVPRGATDAVAAQTPLALTLVTNPAQWILPGIVRETLELQVEAAFYVQRVFGPELQILRQQFDSREPFPASAAVSSLASTINDRLRTLRTVALPPVLDLRFEDARTDPGAQAGGFDFGRYLIPGIIFMSLLFIAQGMTADLWEEQTQGTLRRALSAPAGIASFLAGKLIAGAVLMAAVSLAGLVVSVLLFSVPVARALLAWPWCIFAGSVLFAVFLVPQVAASSQRTANLVASMMVFPLMMIGGSFFPFDVMPPWMAAIGRWTPNGQGVTRLQGLMAGTASWDQVLAPAVAMAVPATLACAWAAHRLRRRFDRGA
jgi:ABC-type multidrug transport system permease subunit